MIQLDALECDALAELGDIGTARASTALGRMIGGEVRVSVPTVECLSYHMAADSLASAFPERLVAVAERLSGSVEGTALLVFPEHRSLELVRAVLPPGVPPEDAPGLADEAMSEIGNIVLNGCLASIANILQISIDIGLPVVLRGQVRDCFAAAGIDGEATAMLVHVALEMADRNLAGRIILALDTGSAASLKAIIGNHVGRVLK